VMRKALDDALANPNYQKEARIQLWKEIGVDITLADKTSFESMRRVIRG